MAKATAKNNTILIIAIFGIVLTFGAFLLFKPTSTHSETNTTGGETTAVGGLGDLIGGLISNIGGLFGKKGGSGTSNNPADHNEPAGD